MKLKVIGCLIIFCFTFCIDSLSQDRIDTSLNHKRLYYSAYAAIKQMLEEKEPINFKKAVFLMENAFSNGGLSFELYNTQIANIAGKLRQLIKERHLEQYKTSGNWATFTYMTDSISQNNFRPYTYDFDNFIPDKDPTAGFVTKLLRTGKGNCNSLPFLYKILAEELSASAYLALAPIHCYIKHRDEKGKWVNLEMTSGSFARDEWIMQETGVTVEQIKTGIYMTALTEKESIALVMKDLASNYQFQFGTDLFDLHVCETALKYFPNSVNLLMVKFEHYRQILLLARAKHDKLQEDQTTKTLSAIDQRLIQLAYKEPSKMDYENWVKENGKSKQSLSSSK